MYDYLPFIPQIFSGELLVEQSITELMQCNEETLPYQLQLTKEEAVLLVETRNEALKITDRIEIGGGMIKKLIHIFKDSPYISQYNYAETISELIDTFYYYKNETLEEISDDDLIDLMKELFDGRCHGAMELLQGKEMDGIAHNIRFNEWDFGQREEIDGVEEENEDE